MMKYKVHKRKKNFSQDKNLMKLNSTYRNAPKMGGGTVGVSPDPPDPPNPRGEGQMTIYSKGDTKGHKSRSKGLYYLRKTMSTQKKNAHTHAGVAAKRDARNKAVKSLKDY